MELSQALLKHLATMKF